MFTMAQIIGGIVLILTVISVQFKTKEKILICQIIAIISGIVTWQNIFSIIPIIAAIVFTFGLWQDNVKITKICTSITSGNWAIYNVIVRAYIGALQSLAEFVSSIIAMIRIKKEND